MPIPNAHSHHSQRCSAWKSTVKLYYYRVFAYLYSLVGRAADVVMVNSSWTHAHIVSLWRGGNSGDGRAVNIVYPPCDTSRLQTLSFEPRQPLIVSVAQFRPEKDHPLQIRAFHHCLQKLGGDGDDEMEFKKNLKLVLIGGARDAEDRKRVESLKELARSLEIDVGSQMPSSIPLPWPSPTFSPL